MSNKNLKVNMKTHTPQLKPFFYYGNRKCGFNFYVRKIYTVTGLKVWLQN